MLWKEDGHDEQVDYRYGDGGVGDIERPPSCDAEEADVEEVDIDEVYDLSVVDAVNDIADSSGCDEGEWPGDAGSISIAIGVIDDKRQQDK